jgi:uncharacterized membrane protein
VGWTNSTGDYKPGDTFVVTGDATLTAVWDNDTDKAKSSADIDDPNTPEVSDDTTAINGGGVPLFGKAGSNWALLNLILAVLGILLAAVAVVRSRRKDSEEDRYGNREDRRKARKTWVIVSIATALIGIILFILTENMSLNMAIMDKWTIFNAVLFIAAGLGASFANKKTDAEETV